MTKEEIAAILENIARLLELKGENPFKIRAYGNAARAMETLPEDVAKLVEEERLVKVDGIGKAIAEKVAELVQTGKLEFYEELKKEFPDDILTLFELQGLGPKKIKVMYDELGVDSIAALEQACKDDKVAALPGFGAKTAENLLRSVEQLRRHSGRFLLSDATRWAEELLEDLRALPEVSLIQAAGSLRRCRETIGDLDFIVSTSQPAEVSAFFIAHPLVETVLAKGETKSSVMLKSGIQCDLRVVTGAEYPFALVYFTGSKEHNIRLRSRALERGWSLNEYRFSKAEGRKKSDPIPEVHDETALYRALNLDFVAPEMREDRGEIEAAAEGTLPELVEWTNLRGTFHCHTTASDGRASLKDMAEAARELGLEYLGIADHSKSSFQAHGLDAKRLHEQVKAIWELNQGYEDFRVFSGIECDILKDGSLDFEDDILAELDYVVASVHSSFGLSEADMTKRLIRAMKNPHVTMLGHPTGRLLLSRDPYAVDIPAVIEAAAETGTMIELNGNPHRLDLDWRWWRLAKEKGVLCVVTPDAHSTQGLHDLLFGIQSARKGGLTRDDIVNCKSLGEIGKHLKAKKLTSG